MIRPARSSGSTTTPIATAASTCAPISRTAGRSASKRTATATASSIAGSTTAPTASSIGWAAPANRTASKTPGSSRTATRCAWTSPRAATAWPTVTSSTTRARSCAPNRTPTATAASISGSASTEASCESCSSTRRAQQAARTRGWCTRPTARCSASTPTSLPSNMLDFVPRRAFVVAMMVMAAAVSSPALAQAPGQGRFVTGPLTWSPTFQLREAGVDSNVFNTPLDPKEDVTAGALSSVSSLLTLGILEATTTGSLEYLYFDRYKNDRGFNRRVATHLEFPLTRFSPDVTATAGRQKQTYEEGVTLRDVESAPQLNRESTLGTLTGRVTGTPLTTFEAVATLGRDAFPFRPAADTDNMRLDAGFEFSPDAIIRGRASIGYHSMQPHRNVSNAVAANFTGITSSVDLSYTLLEVTRFTGRFARDSSYSIDTNQPYYVSTGGSLEVLQTLFGPVDLTVRAAREKLDYPATDLEAGHADFADTFGGGPSIRMGPQAVIALLYDSSERRSPRGPEFGYQRRRIYTTVTYGF